MMQKLHKRSDWCVAKHDEESLYILIWAEKICKDFMKEIFVKGR